MHTILCRDFRSLIHSSLYLFCQNNGFAPLKTSVQISKYSYNKSVNVYYHYMKRTFKQWCSSIPAISPKLSIISIEKKTTTYDVRNPGPGSWHEITTTTLFNFPFTLFLFNKMSLSFHLFFLNLACSCPHSCTKMLTVTYVCRSYYPLLVIIYFQYDWWIIKDR